jgi:CPA2 family monovalent cation:H+ antiporter-2
LLGWTSLESVFLGGMLAMSSTTIIIKAFNDLKLRNRKFTNIVFGTLVVEDIVGILMMVVMSTIAVSRPQKLWGHLTLSVIIIFYTSQHI